jgi:hypothetical protein
MPRGRRIDRPAEPSPPTLRPRGDPRRYLDLPAEALIDAARAEWARAARIRVLWPDGPTRGSWIDRAHHPHDPKSRGRPKDPAVALLRQALRRLRRNRRWRGRRWTAYRTQRYIADRLLMLTPRTRWASVFKLPAHVALPATGEDQEYAATRRWLMNRIHQLTR